MCPRKLRMWICATMLTSVVLLCVLRVSASPGGFVFTGNLNRSRGFLQSATLLNNGLVLIAGGDIGISSAELYNPTSGVFTLTGSMSVGRKAHSATLLNNGMVLIAGGAFEDIQGTNILASAELYNPATGIFTVTGSMSIAREYHTATLLSDGTVLIAGGGNNSASWVASAEIYNPTTGTFTVTGNLGTARTQHTAIMLNNGMTLIAGGVNNTGILASAEVYNSSTRTFAPTGSLRSARGGHIATLLNNGKVLVAGGSSSSSNIGIASAELYDPVAGSFAFTGSMNTSRALHCAALLNNGMVLVAGGEYFSGGQFHYPTQAELYDPGSGAFTFTGSMNVARIEFTATLLNNGMVLVASGTGAASRTAELYQPISLTPSGLLSITLTPSSPWTPIGSFLSFTATGHFSGGVTQTLASATWSSSNSSVATISNDSGNYGHAYGVSSGSVTIKACTGTTCGSTTLTVAPHSNLILGSQPTDTARSTFEKYDDSGNRLLTGNLSIPRAYHSAVLLNDGHIFVVGGTDNTTSWQIFDQNGNVVSSGLLNDGRVLAAATLLTNGNVFLAGGTSSPGTWEIRSSTGALMASGNLNGSRTGGLSALTLKNGNIWISGSALANGDACTWEIHNINGGLVNSGSLMSCFGGAQVQVLGNGNVILLGGGNASGTYEIRSQTGAFVSTGSLTNAFNQGASSALLNNGNVLVFGSCQVGNPPPPPDPNGCGTPGSQSTWEIRDVNGNFVSTGSLFNTRDGAGAAVLPNGNVFITGGSSCPACWETRSQSGSLVSQGSLFNTRYGGHSLTHF